MPELNTSSDESSASTEHTGAAAASERTGGSASEKPSDETAGSKAPARKRAPARTTAQKPTKKAAPEPESKPEDTSTADEGGSGASEADQTAAAAAKPKRKPRKSAATTPELSAAPTPDAAPPTTSGGPRAEVSAGPAQPGVLFQAPDFEAAPLFTPPERSTESEESRRDSGSDSGSAAGSGTVGRPSRAKKTPEASGTEHSSDDDSDDGAADDDSGDDGPRRRRRRGGRGRRRRGEDETAYSEGADSHATETGDSADASSQDNRTDTGTADSGGDAGSGPEADSDADADTDGGQGSGSRRRRRRRRRTSDESDDADSAASAKVRDGREVEDEVTSLKGSTRLEAKKQRRREGREAGRRRPPILSEAEFLARRESVDRVMAVRQTGDLTQIAVLEDDVLVEHYVSQATQQSLIGNVYLGRVQNVLPAMEAAFVDIGRGRNAVIYASEVDWSDRSKGDGPRRIEDVLKSGQSILVQVTKDPVGHKGARLTSQISLPGRYLVYVPGGSMSGISRKLPDTERNRLKNILKKVVPDDAGVIVRTAAEGASEEELTRDASRLQQQWEAIRAKSGGQGPVLLHGEPNLAIKVVRDLFNEDFTKLLVGGDQVWTELEDYVTHVAPSLADRVQKWTGPGDLFAEKRIDEQIAKALDRKVWLPSGGSLIIDRTEAMTVVDVNTGKFTGSGGNLEETVTKNNLEAAEEIVRQLRLRDIGGIIVIDFIDMVLEANRDLVLRRLVECLGRDRTKHQVAEVTSLGLVQMTRKRIGTGLLEAFSEPCPHCKGRGLTLHTHPHESGSTSEDSGGSGSRRSARGRRRRDEDAAAKASEPTPGPKLDASALPDHASPADLFAGGTNGTESTGDNTESTGGNAGSESGSETATPASEAETTDTAVEQTSERRGRRHGGRRAGRPGSPSPASSTTDDTSQAGEPVAADPEPSTSGPSTSGPRAGETGTESILAEAPAGSPRRGRRRAERPAGRPESATAAVANEDTSASVVTATTVGTAAVETVTRRPRRRVERPAGKPDPHPADSDTEGDTTSV